MWPFELSTLREGDTGPGLLPPRLLAKVFTATAALGLMLLWFKELPTLPLLLLAVATLLLVRQLILDLCHETLLDIYNLPLAILGLIWAGVYGVGITQSLLGGVLGFGVSLGLSWVISRIKPGLSGLGGGDVKLLGVMGLWLGPLGLLLAFMLGNFINLAVALIFNRSSLPQGPGLIIGLWVMLLWPNSLIHLFLMLAQRIS